MFPLAPMRTALIWLAVFLFGIVPVGCIGLKIPTFKSKPKVESGSVSASKEEPIPVKVESCFIAPGPIVRLEIASNWLRLAATWQDRESLKTSLVNRLGNRDGSPLYNRWHVALVDMRYSKATPEATAILDPIAPVLASTFSESGETFFVADADPARERNNSGFVKANIRALVLKERTEYSALLDHGFDEERIRLSSGAKWIACKGRDTTWRLIDRDDPNRVVFFPKITVEKASKQWENKEEKIEAVVTDVLAFSPNQEFVATLVSDCNRDHLSLDDAEYSLDETESQSNEISSGQWTNEEGDRERNLYRTIVIWDLKLVGNVPLDKAKLPLDAIEVSRFRATDGIGRRRCAFSSDGTMIAVRSKSRYVGIWQTATGRLLSELGEHPQPITSLKFSPNNIKLAVATGEKQGAILIWDVRKESPERFYEEENPQIHKITALTYSPDGEQLFFGTDTGEVKRWFLSE